MRFAKTINWQCCVQTVLIAVYCLLICCLFGGCLAGAFAATNTVAAATSASPWWLEPATIWDIVKWLSAAVVAVVTWGIRVELTLSRHDSTLATQTKTLTHIESIIDDWAKVKEERAERLTRLETKIDFLISAQDRK